MLMFSVLDYMLCMHFYHILVVILASYTYPTLYHTIPTVNDLEKEAF